MRNKKRILIVLMAVYLIVLGVLTVCSNQILQITLPGVSVERAKAQMINGIYYNTVIHIDAVCYDNSGNSYILIVEERKTPLGERRFVRHVPVSIEETDTVTGLAAIEGALDGSDWVVYQRNMDLEDGQQVQLIELSG